jgi:hypothetical protein
MLTAKGRLSEAVKDTGKHWIEDAISIKQFLEGPSKAFAMRAISRDPVAQSQR